MRQMLPPWSIPAIEASCFPRVAAVRFAACGGCRAGAARPKLLSSPALDVGSPAVSRDGQHIAFVKVLYDSDIWQVSAAGGEAALLTSSEFPDSSPQFSPDGRKVAFVSSRAGAPDVWVADASGANAVRITDSGGQQVSVCSLVSRRVEDCL